ncbi:hypothetical protein BGZ63DRAFT_400772 [Mariannaea sp. PMI_226]|nr:hypothetical protein BGZ63DRAFT_400772 [Mariannaea sp. PMI_226]
MSAAATANDHTRDLTLHNGPVGRRRLHNLLTKEVAYEQLVITISHCALKNEILPAGGESNQPPSNSQDNVDKEIHHGIGKCDNVGYSLDQSMQALHVVHRLFCILLPPHPTRVAAAECMRAVLVLFVLDPSREAAQATHVGLRGSGVRFEPPGGPGSILGDLSED